MECPAAIYFAAAAEMALPAPLSFSLAFWCRQAAFNVKHKLYTRHCFYVQFASRLRPALTVLLEGRADKPAAGDPPPCAYLWAARCG